MDVYHTIGHIATWSHKETQLHNGKQELEVIVVSLTIDHMRHMGTKVNISSKWTTGSGIYGWYQTIGHKGALGQIQSHELKMANQSLRI